MRFAFGHARSFHAVMCCRAVDLGSGRRHHLLIHPCTSLIPLTEGESCCQRCPWKIFPGTCFALWVEGAFRYRERLCKTQHRVQFHFSAAQRNNQRSEELSDESDAMKSDIEGNFTIKLRSSVEIRQHNFVFDLAK